MSGWDASSRRTWDPQGGAGDSTQAFPAPEIPEDADDLWPDLGRRQFPADSPPDRQASRHDPGGLGYEPGPAGPPPDIFQQDYGQQDYGQQDYGRRDGAGREYGRENSRQDGYGLPGPAGQDHARDYAQRDYPPREDPWPRDDPWPREDPWPRDDAQRDVLRDHTPADRAMDRSGADFAGRGQGFRGDGGPGADPDYAARMDPALQDFFAPQGPPLGMAQPGPGQQRYGARGYAAQGASRTARDPAAGQSGRPRQPGQPNPNDRTRARPGARSRSSRSARRGVTVGVVLGVLGVVAVAAVGVKFMLGGKGNPTAGSKGANATSAAASASPKGPAPSVNPEASTAGKPAAKQTGYLLTTPATAGGYPLLTPVPAAVQGAASTTAQAVRGSVVSNGGKVTSQVSAGYQLSGGQVMSFTGYEGAFTPAKVIASLGANARTYAAGADGGSLACFTASGAQPGTVCVWATTTTMGITEFFSSVGPEVVTIQSKAASDTVQVRNSVEHRG